MIHLLKNELAADPVRKFGAMLAQGAFRSIKKRLDPEVYGGAALLGLNGIVIKAHGSSRERAIMNAIRVAAEEVSHGLNRMISEQIIAANQRLAAFETAASTSLPA
jgi:glycerol-3-phosphate acyltransferase PlsX